MQAYKLQGKVDRDGKLIITEPTNLIPGDVEIIVLQSETKKDDIYPEKQLKNRPTKVKAFQDWFAKTELIPANLDIDEAKWEYLQGKHNL